MANRKVTKDTSNLVAAGAILANFYLDKRVRLVEAHATDHDKVVIKGSNLIPIQIGEHWFYLDTDVDVTLPTDLDSYQADQVVDSCDSAWTAKANVTATEELAIKKEGTASAKLVIADVFTTGLVATHDFSAIDISGYNSISFWIRSTSNLNKGVLQLVYDEDAACASPSQSTDIPALKADTWTKVSLTLSAAAADRNAVISVGINGVSDPGAITIYVDDVRTEMQEAGKDYNVYACDNVGVLTFKISLNSTYPSCNDSAGNPYTANNTRKVAGLHTLCLDAFGVSASHALYEYETYDILPASIWDLKHRVANGTNVGMVYDEAINKWVDIYLASSTGATCASVYGATIQDTRNWLDFVDDGHAVKKRLLHDEEFQSAMAGSNEETNIFASADPVTTGGHMDTAARRMISDIGCEDGAGAMYQWLLDQSYRVDGLALSITAAAQTATVTYIAAPGGNQIYLKFDNGVPYLCCNMATDTEDKIITLGTNYKITIKHDVNAAAGGLPIYFDDDATQPSRLLVNNTVLSKDCYIEVNHPQYSLKLKHDASAATNGVALSFDDGADERLEAANAGTANAGIDLTLLKANDPTWGWYDLPAPGRGSLYKQGNVGDVKLLAGLAWSYGAYCGSRGRYAYHYRWSAATSIGARFLAEPL